VTARHDRAERRCEPPARSSGGAAPPADESGEVRVAPAVAPSRDDAAIVAKLAAAIVTCDRPGSLARAAASFVDAGRRHGGAPRVVVFDDSRAAPSRAANVASLRALAASEVDVSYAGPAEKRAFAARLARASGVDERTVAFALLDPERCGLSVGANRNAALLHFAGDAFAVADDDVEASVAKDPESDRGVVCTGEIEATRTRFFRDRRAALAAAARADLDPLAEHRAVLGRTLRSLVDAAGDLADLRGARPEMIDGARTGAMRVVATLTGIFGDSGMSSGVGFLLHWPDIAAGARGGAVASSEADYRLALASREVFRAPRRIALARSGLFMAGSLGLDHRALLPPFFPVMRNEDGVFGTTLRRAFEGACWAHLPCALLHAADEGRAYEVDAIAASEAARLSEIVASMIHRVSFSPGAGTPSSRLAALGRNLADVSRERATDFRDRVRGLLLDNAAARAARLEALLHVHAARAPFWAVDARAHLARTRAAAAREDLHVPRDLAALRGPRGAAAFAQRLIGRFGELLVAWPALVVAARALRAEGVALARPIERRRSPSREPRPGGLSGVSGPAA